MIVYTKLAGDGSSDVLPKFVVLEFYAICAKNKTISVRNGSLTHFFGRYGVLCTYCEHEPSKRVRTKLRKSKIDHLHGTTTHAATNTRCRQDRNTARTLIRNRLNKLALLIFDTIKHKILSVVTV
jgi:hypothetical protein